MVTYHLANDRETLLLSINWRRMISFYSYMNNFM